MIWLSARTVALVRAAAVQSSSGNSVVCAPSIGCISGQVSSKGEP